jgi:hypothetical protein
MAPFPRGVFNQGSLALGFSGQSLTVCSPSLALGRGDPLASTSAQYSLRRSGFFPGRRHGARRPSPCVSQLRLDFPDLFLYTLSLNFISY